MGFDAAVVEQVERRAGLKRYAGHPLFVYAAFATWLRHYDRSRPRFAVSAGPSAEGPPAAFIDDGYFAVCLKTNPYTFFGNLALDLAPEAGFDTGLSLVVLRTLRLTTTVRLAVSLLRGGHRLRNHRKVVFASDLSEITVTGHGPFPYQVDGDFLGQTEHLVLRCEPDALTLILPGDDQHGEGPEPPLSDS
jgi:diacylglycerol kinase family enzyme